MGAPRSPDQFVQDLETKGREERARKRAEAAARLSKSVFGSNSATDKDPKSDDEILGVKREKKKDDTQEAVLNEKKKISNEAAKRQMARARDDIINHAKTDQFNDAEGSPTDLDTQTTELNNGKEAYLQAQEIDDDIKQRQAEADAKIAAADRIIADRETSAIDNWRTISSRIRLTDPATGQSLGANETNELRNVILQINGGRISALSDADLQRFTGYIRLAEFQPGQQRNSSGPSASETKALRDLQKEFEAISAQRKIKLENEALNQKKDFEIVIEDIGKQITNGEIDENKAHQILREYFYRNAAVLSNTEFDDLVRNFQQEITNQKIAMDPANKDAFDQLVDNLNTPDERLRAQAILTFKDKYYEGSNFEEALEELKESKLIPENDPYFIFVSELAKKQKAIREAQEKAQASSDKLDQGNVDNELLEQMLKDAHTHDDLLNILETNVRYANLADLPKQLKLYRYVYDDINNSRLAQPDKDRHLRSLREIRKKYFEEAVVDLADPDSEFGIEDVIASVKTELGVDNNGLNADNVNFDQLYREYQDKMFERYLDRLSTAYINGNYDLDRLGVVKDAGGNIIIQPDGLLRELINKREINQRQAEAIAGYILRGLDNTNPNTLKNEIHREADYNVRMAGIRRRAIQEIQSNPNMSDEMKAAELKVLEQYGRLTSFEANQLAKVAAQLDNWRVRFIRARGYARLIAGGLIVGGVFASFAAGTSAGGLPIGLFTGAGAGLLGSATAYKYFSTGYQGLKQAQEMQLTMAIAERDMQRANDNMRLAAFAYEVMNDRTLDQRQAEMKLRAAGIDRNWANGFGNVRSVVEFQYNEVVNTRSKIEGYKTKSPVGQTQAAA